MTTKTNMIWCFCLVTALVIGFLGGYWVAKIQARSAVLCGPYSDDYIPALDAIAEARTKIDDGDQEIGPELDRARYHIEHAQEWARRFLGQPPAGADSARSGPVRP